MQCINLQVYIWTAYDKKVNDYLQMQKQQKIDEKTSKLCIYIEHWLSDGNGHGQSVFVFVDENPFNNGNHC